MPSSFRGDYGKIVYSLEARLSRSMRIDKKDSTKMNFVSKADLLNNSELMVVELLLLSTELSLIHVISNSFLAL